MKFAKVGAPVLLAWFFCSGPVRAQAAKDTEPAGQASATASPSEEASTWALSLSAYAYFVPDSPNYLMPLFSVDHEALHLEARYNYEDLVTGSAWAGYNFSGGNELDWELTPILGAVFGNTNGIAPGYKGSLSWWKLELYSEGEYVLDFSGGEANFFYNWSELTLAPCEFFRFGLVTQRTRAYAAERELQRGLLAGFSYDIASLTLYVLNPDDSEPIWIVAAGLSFE